MLRLLIYNFRAKKNNDLTEESKPKCAQGNA